MDSSLISSPDPLMAPVICSKAEGGLVPGENFSCWWEQLFVEYPLIVDPFDHYWTWDDLFFMENYWVPPSPLLRVDDDLDHLNLDFSTTNLWDIDHHLLSSCNKANYASSVAAASPSNFVSTDDHLQYGRSGGRPRWDFGEETTGSVPLAAAVAVAESSSTSTTREVLLDDQRPSQEGRWRSNTLDFEEISKYFYVPITQAAKELKVGLTVLKKRCRELGISRWPHRKMKSLNSLIHNVQELKRSSGGPGEMSSVRMEEIERLEEHKKLMEKRPELQLSEETKKLRQACFKANYKKRRLMAFAASPYN